MLRSLVQCTLLILFLESVLLGQGVTDGRKTSLPSPGSASSSPAVPSSSPQPTVSTVPDLASDALSEAIRHYLHGEFDAAIQNYNLVLQKDPKSPDAYAGLTRVYLKQKKVEEAYETVTNGVKVTDAPVVHIALGEVYFRQGKIPEAEQEWVNVINKGYPSARAYWGLSRVRTALSLYQQAKEMLDKAYELDHQDPDIQKYWINSLTRAEQIQFWEKYLASPTNDDAETRADMQHHLDYLRAMQNQPHYACRLVSHFPSTETKLLRILTDLTHMRGYALAVSLNGKKGNLVLDTGASGILIDRGLARKAGITELSETDIGGIGDKGRTGGYVGFASSIKIGELEFQDCRVSVIEKRSVLGDDGLIGGNVFGAFLVDIDFPNEKLRLKPLPKRPNENTTEVTLQTGKEGSVPSGDQSSGKAGPDPRAKSSPSAYHGPRDRYIAPEMQSYTQVYRFGHALLVPTRIGDLTPRLFLLDTGGSMNLMSLKAAQESTKVRNNSRVQVQGLSGSVAKVYSADKAVLQFGHLQQEDQDVTTFDLSHLSDNVGTEISGVLGFTTLHFLEIRIDYRDGIVDFIYKPHP
ncbi:MAG: aspartyl protease family protein [Terriglobia bacterium]